MSAWVIWMVAAGLLAIGEILTLSFFMGPIAVAAVLAGVAALLGAGHGAAAGRLHPRLDRVAARCCARSRRGT